MELLIFKSDIKSQAHVKRVEPLLNNLEGILDWSVDLEDIDCVLRVETTESLTATSFKNLLDSNGVLLQDLPD
ncbi:hypothetical protein [Wenyingzhuangia sp. 2_MG-2023]|uniref:hypothetical protein n=1 Tax=Wenyingzhuangia sp. 2_MG-2023 TaxID=3062639 RepID=UPI0026E258B7|nr:hypothetical protein [Wenyingzhuangia sp. 2_MG-2023]MDO6738965.1 hypothetical protein [Wenyingzhuangia sp. 2_MG-2023]